jgi:HEAT repeat protein
MSKHTTQELNFSEVKDALLNKQAPFPPQFIYFFSDISQGDLDKIALVWPQVWLERRRGLLEDMENLAEADTLLYFDDFARTCLSDADPVARATAMRLLWQSENEQLVPLLLNLLKEDPEAIVRSAAATGLGGFVYRGELEELKQSTYKTIVQALIGVYLGPEDVLVRRRALEALGYASHPDVPGFIQTAYDTNDEEWLQSALFAMGRTCNRKWAKSILGMFAHPDPEVRYEAVRAAGELEIEDARESLFDLLEEGTDDEDLYYAAIWTLTKIGGSGVRELIEVALDETDDAEELNFLEEALENLNFTEQVQHFDLMNFDEDELEDMFSDDVGPWSIEDA